MCVSAFSVCFGVHVRYFLCVCVSMYVCIHVCDSFVYFACAISLRSCLMCVFECDVSMYILAYLSTIGYPADQTNLIQAYLSLHAQGFNGLILSILALINRLGKC